MTKKKHKHYNLCKDCLLRHYCKFKDKDDQKTKVVGLFGTEGIGLECPDDLGGYPELPGVPPVEKKKKKDKDIEKEKNRIEELEMIVREGVASIPGRAKIKEKDKNTEDPLDTAFLKKIADNEDKK